MAYFLTDVLEKVIVMRKDFGYPVMTAPYSQIVRTYALENVLFENDIKTS